MSNVELLPLPELPRQVEGYSSDYWEASQVEEYATDYARACVAHATAAKDAEIEALQVAYLAQLAERANEIRLREKAEVRAEALRAKARYALDNAARSLTAARAARDAAEVRAERLAEALREAAAMLLADYPETVKRLRAALHPTAAQED